MRNVFFYGAGISLLLAGAACAQADNERGIKVKAAQEAGISTYDPARFHALVIGINKYNKWTKLRTAVNDASAVGDALVSHYGFPPGQVRRLLDENATRRNILAELDRLADLGPADSVLIYYAGHGWMDSLNNGFWVPVDAPEDDKFAYVSNAQIVQEYFKKYRVKHLLVVSDSCFSGTLLRGKDARREANWRIPAGFQKPSRWVMTSGDLAPVPDDAGTGHSPFATRLLQYLRYGDDTAFGIYDLFGFVKRNLDSGAICEPLDTPSHMPGGEFVLARLDRPVDLPVPPPSVDGRTTPKSGMGSERPREPSSGSPVAGGKGNAPSANMDFVRKHDAMRQTSEAARLQKEAEARNLQADEHARRATANPAYTDSGGTGSTPSASGQSRSVDLGGGVSLELLPVDAGSFRMGSNAGESDEKPMRTVRVTRDFWVGKTEVTQQQYQQLMGSNPSQFKGDDLPVETVSWDGAVKFCEELTKRESAANRLSSGYVYRLPTEAEWEYAARGGEKNRNTQYAGSHNLDSVAWHSGNSGGRTQLVGTKAANELGLHDMSGNVWEWCHDWYQDNYNGLAATDPSGPSSGSLRVFRGGSWDNSAANCRVANRNGDWPSDVVSFMGFRVVLATAP